MAKILAVTYGGGHVAMVIPVARRLAGNPGNRLTILGLTTAAPALRAAKLPFKGFRDYVNPVRDSAAMAFGKGLADKWHSDGKGIDRSESVAYLGLSMWDLIQEHGEGEARRKLAQHGRQALLPVETLMRVLRVEAPDVVLATSSPRAETAALLAAKRLGIPAVRMEDLVAFGVKALPPATAYTAMSSLARDALIRLGALPRCVHVTGQPAFDCLAGFNSEIPRATVRQHLGLGSGDTLLVYATQASPHKEMEPLLALVEAVLALPSARLVVKLHPSDDPLWVGPLLVPLKNRALVVQHYGASFTNLELLAAADVVLVMDSTVGLEAALVDRPVVTLNFSNEKVWLPLADMGLAVNASERSEVLPAISEVLGESVTRARLAAAREPLRPDGLAAERVAVLVEQLAGGTP